MFVDILPLYCCYLPFNCWYSAINSVWITFDSSDIIFYLELIDLLHWSIHCSAGLIYLNYISVFQNLQFYIISSINHYYFTYFNLIISIILQHIITKKLIWRFNINYFYSTLLYHLSFLYSIISIIVLDTSNQNFAIILVL